MISISMFTIFADTLQVFGVVNPQVEPRVEAMVKCMVASTIIPVDFNATGFPPSTHLGIALNQRNDTVSDYPKDLFLNATGGDGIVGGVTNSLGSLTGSFDVNTTIDDHSLYILHIFVDANKDGLSDNGKDTASSRLECG
jgi:hypothetical protein